MTRRKKIVNRDRMSASGYVEGYEYEYVGRKCKVYLANENAVLLNDIDSRLTANVKCDEK